MFAHSAIDQDASVLVVPAARSSGGAVPQFAHHQHALQSGALDARDVGCGGEGVVCHGAMVRRHGCLQVEGKP